MPTTGLLLFYLGQPVWSRWINGTVGKKVKNIFFQFFKFRKPIIEFKRIIWFIQKLMRNIARYCYQGGILKLIITYLSWNNNCWVRSIWFGSSTLYLRHLGWVGWKYNCLILAYMKEHIELSNRHHNVSSRCMWRPQTEFVKTSK